MELVNYSILNEQERNSVKSHNEYDYPWIGLLIFHTFVIDLKNLVKNKLYICREYHIQPSEIDRMQYWEYEWLTDDIKEITKEQEKQQKEQQKESEALKSSFNPNNMMRNVSNSMPSMPKINLPKL